MKHHTHLLAAAAACLLAATSAAAATSVGNTSVDDVTLNALDADAYVFADGWNPHAGPAGDTSGFGSGFDSYGSGSWSLLDRLDLNSGFSNNGMLHFAFSQLTPNSGTWSVSNVSASNVTLDLVYAMHAGDGGAGFLFDDQAIMAGQTLNGTWRIEWFTGANQAYPAFSNVALFGRDLQVTPAPEPAAYAMLLAGLGVLGMAGRRRKAS